MVRKDGRTDAGRRCYMKAQTATQLHLYCEGAIEAPRTSCGSAAKPMVGSCQSNLGIDTAASIHTD
eukprot:365399-Alexandrium_andersonii.AAC.1